MNNVHYRWGIHAGLDSSDQKYMVERYSLEDDGMTLKILITVTDPVYLSEPLVIDYSMTSSPTATPSVLPARWSAPPCFSPVTTVTKSPAPSPNRATPRRTASTASYG